MREKFSLIPFLRRSLFITLFATLVTMAGISLISAQSNVGSTIPPGGTVPGGTVPPSPAGQGQVNVIHLAASTQTMDVCTQAGTPVTGATNLNYLEQSGYLTLPVGNYDWKVTTPGCSATLVDLAPFTLFEQAVLTIVIIGDGADQPFSSVVLVQNGGLSLRQYAPIVANQP